MSKKTTNKRREPLGDTIRRLREERGLSVNDAADRAGYNSVLWLKLEGEANDQTPLATLRIIAKGLGMTLRHLAAELERGPWGQGFAAPMGLCKQGHRVAGGRYVND